MFNAGATWLQLVASLLSVLIAAIAIALAVSAARDQRRNRDFPSDKAYAESFVQAVADLPQDVSLGDISRRDASLILNQAVAGYGTRSRRGRNEINGWLSRLDQAANRILEQPPGEGSLSFEDSQAYDAIVSRACEVAVDWAYPERRKSVLVEFYREHAAELSTPTSSVEVQVARWLLVGLPSDTWIEQRGRETGVWVRRLIDDLRHHRIASRWREWTMTRRISREERRANDRQVRFGGSSS